MRVGYEEEVVKATTPEEAVPAKKVLSTEETLSKEEEAFPAKEAASWDTGHVCLEYAITGFSFLNGQLCVHNLF